MFTFGFKEFDIDTLLSTIPFGHLTYFSAFDTDADYCVLFVARAGIFFKVNKKGIGLKFAIQHTYYRGKETTWKNH